MKYILTTAIFCLLITASYAQDRVFGYTYQSNVLNKGDFDLEFWNTLSTGKVGDNSPYIYGQHLDQRLEFEFGLGKNVQTAFYLNSELFNYAFPSSEGMEQEHKVSFSNEWKWKLSDPVANGIGFALYEEFEFGGNNVEFETKLIFDKRFQNDLFAFNLVHKYEIEKEIEVEDEVAKAEWENSSALEFYFGYMHFFKSGMGLGLEMRNNNDISDEDGRINSVLFAGPAFSASVEKFFVNISVLPQLGNLHKTDWAPGSMDLNNYEKLEVRLMAGYNF